MNQGLNICKTCISKTGICSGLILPSKPRGVLNLKPLFRPTRINLKRCADLERHNFPEDVAAAPYGHQNWPEKGLGAPGDILSPATGTGRLLSPGSHHAAAGAAGGFPSRRRVLRRDGGQGEGGAGGERGAFPRPPAVPLSCWGCVRGLAPSQHAGFHNNKL